MYETIEAEARHRISERVRLAAAPRLPKQPRRGLVRRLRERTTT